jgi:flagellin
MASNTVIQTNVLALNSHRNLSIIGSNREKASAKLSSGYRINTAADDAAGLAISEKMRAQIRGLDQASRNAQDGISMLQTTEGGLTEIDNMIQRIRELTVQASSDSNVAGQNEDTGKIQLEINALLSEISDMGERVEFNSMSVLNLKDTSAIRTFQIGANEKQGIMFDFKKVHIAKTIHSELKEAIASKIDTGSWKVVDPLLSNIDTALTKVVVARAELGAVINRLEFTNRSLQVSSENLSASESRIRDADMGKEMMQLTKSNILQQAGVSMLAQANQSPQSVLQLLQ